jgi:protein CWC15
MTTAHRPTWNSAKGGGNQGGNLLVQPTRAYSSKDLPGHLKLKTRREG